MNNTKQKTKLLTITAIFAAMITVMTAYICHIPVPIAGGYMHFGDSLIYLAASILPAPYAMAAAAIGGGLADLLTAPVWALPTIIIKMLITIPFTNKQSKIITPCNLFAPILAYFISGTGYYFANTLLFGEDIAFITSYLGSLAQSGGSAIFFIIFGIALDKIKFKQKLSI